MTDQGLEEDFREIEDTAPPIRLREGIDIDELKNEGSMFELQDLNPSDMPADDYFDDAEVYKYYSEDTQTKDDDGDTSDDGDLTPFARLANKMTDITKAEDGGVLKELLHQGTGNIVPPDAYVTVNYNAYLEYSDEPYDSTWLRSAPARFSLGQGEMIEGLEIAISSMKVGEVSKYLIKPGYAYGQYGCAPRIPGDTVLLFRIEMMKFVEYGGVNQYYRMSRSEKKEAGFKLINKVALKAKQDAMDHFGRCRYPQATRGYESAIKCLEECHLQNDEDESQQQRLLLKLYLNTAICHLKQNHHARVISYCHQALEIEEQNPKAFFLKGKALRLMGEWRPARTFLCRAQRIAPDNKDVTQELEKLAHDVKNFEAIERDMCRKMFLHTVKSPGGSVADQSTQGATGGAKERSVPLSGCSDDFRQLVSENLQSFKDNKELIEMPMPSSGFTAEEEACIRDTAKELGLCVRKRREGSSETLQIFKPKPDD